MHLVLNFPLDGIVINRFYFVQYLQNFFIFPLDSLNFWSAEITMTFPNEQKTPEIEAIDNDSI